MKMTEISIHHHTKAESILKSNLMPVFDEQTAENLTHFYQISLARTLKSSLFILELG